MDKGTNKNSAISFTQVSEVVNSNQMEKKGFTKSLKMIKDEAILPKQITTDRRTQMRISMRENESSISHQVSEVVNSNQMEKKGFIKSLKMIKDEGILPKQITTDRRTQMRTSMRENESSISHQVSEVVNSNQMEKKGFIKSLKMIKDEGILPKQITTDRRTQMRMPMREIQSSISHQVSELVNSNQMEKKGFIKSVKMIKDEGILPKQITTDCRTQIRRPTRENESSISHQFDV